MSRRRALPAVLAIAAAAGLAACGGTAGEDARSTPADTLVKPLVREPLTEADLVGLTLAELAVELPWTTNRITRNAVPGAPASAVESVDVVGHETFDRATFLLDDSLPPPGYDVMLADSGTTVACAGGEHGLPARSLLVTFSPARIRTDGGSAPRAGVQATSASRMPRAGIVCDDGARLVWTAELGQGSQVRVLELRAPSRVAVDVR